MASLRSASKMTRILGALVLVTGTLAVLAPSAGAAPAPCRVRNVTTTHLYRGGGLNLQKAIDAATPGTELTVRGLCRGNFTISKDLTLVGLSMAAHLTPTLNGNHAGSVLAVTAGSVILKDLTVTNGWLDIQPGGGGISNWGSLTLEGSTRVTGNEGPQGGGIQSVGSLTLKGSSSVTGNLSEYGAGILSYGSLTLMGSSSVSDNTGVNIVGSYPSGAGIFNFHGTVTLEGASSVAGNSAAGFGGGIYNEWGHLTLRDSSSVTGNQGPRNGGGIVNDHGVVNLAGSSSVSGNTSTVVGGGIYSQFGVVNLKGSSSVAGNTSVTGGGIYNYRRTTWGRGSVTLRSSSFVTGNTATGGTGGGIFNDGTGILNACNSTGGDEWTGAISPNNPDDPLVPTLIAC